MAQIHKAAAIARQLAGKVKVRLPSLTVSETVDSSQNPVVQIGAAATTDDGAVVRVIGLAWPLAEDVLGNAAQSFGPHVVQVCIEDAANSPASELAIMAEAFASGARVELYKTTAGTVPSVSAMISGNLVATIDADPSKGIIANA